MKWNQKLEIIQKTLGLTQTRLAERFDVSFVTLNSWWNEKSTPRGKKQALIEDLFLEVTGQKIIPENELKAKKQILAKLSAVHKNIPAAILKNADIRDQFILKLTYHSNRMEGSTLTEPDTAAILFDNAALPNKSLIEHLEAKNHQTALNHVFSHALSRGPIDEPLILKLHGMLMNGIYADAGLYRRHAVRIVGVNLATANFLKIPSLLPELMTTAGKKTTDVIRQCAAVHSRFEHIHPFSDGNGRVGRLLMTAMLLRANLAPAIILQQKKQLYYTYLHKAQTTDDHSQLESFLCDSVTDGFRILERKDLSF